MFGDRRPIWDAEGQDATPIEVVQPSVGVTWEFGSPRDDEKSYADGTSVPGRKWIVYYNSKAVGEIEVHMHRRRGPDGVDDLSFGATFIAYGPPNSPERVDTW